MAGHRERLYRLNLNSRHYGKPQFTLLRAFGSGTAGPVNIKIMDAIAGAMYEHFDESAQYTKQAINLFDNMLENGPATLALKNGRYASEQGSTGMHNSFTQASILAPVLHAPINSKIFDLAARLIGREMAFYREFTVYGTPVPQIFIPASRIKKQKQQIPWDGYRDEIANWFLADKMPTRVRSLHRDQDIALWNMVQLRGIDKFSKRYSIVKDHYQQARDSNSGVELKFPVERIADTDSMVARLLDTPEARKNLIQVCHRLTVIVQDGNTTLFVCYEWENTPQYKFYRAAGTKKFSYVESAAFSAPKRVIIP